MGLSGVVNWSISRLVKTNPTVKPTLLSSINLLWYGLAPVCRAEHRSFRRDKSAGKPICMRSTRRGAARRPRVARGPRTALLATPGESEKRRREAATGRLFFGYFLFGCKDSGGRAPTVGALGDAGAIAEAEHKFAWSKFEQPIRLARRAKTREGFRSESISPSGARTRFKPASRQRLLK